MSTTTAMIGLLIFAAIAHLVHEHRRRRKAQEEFEIHRARIEAGIAAAEQTRRERRAQFTAQVNAHIAALESGQVVAPRLALNEGSGVVAGMDPCNFDHSNDSGSFSSSPRMDDDDFDVHDRSAIAGLDLLDQLHGYYGAGEQSLSGWSHDNG